MNISQINNTNFSSDELNYTKKVKTATEQEYDTGTPEISIDSTDEDGEVVLSKAGSNFDGTASKASILAEFGDMKSFDDMLDLVCCAGTAAINLASDLSSYGCYKGAIAVKQMQDNTAISPGVTNLEADQNSTVEDIMSFTTPESIKNENSGSGSKFNTIDYLELLYKYELLCNKLKTTTDEDEQQEIKDAMNCILEDMRDLL